MTMHIFKVNRNMEQRVNVSFLFTGRGGGGRRGGGVFFFGGGGGGGGGGGLPTWLIIILVIILVALLIYSCYVCSKSCDSESPQYAGASSDEYTKCYLCMSRIRQSKWDDGSHRKACIMSNRSMVDAMPAPYPVNCPNCSKRLKQWPEQGPEVKSHIILKHL